MKNYFNDDNNPFGLSIGDLMAALLLVFVLLLTSTLLKLQKERENVVQVAREYLETKSNIHKELLKEFKDDIDNWDITIDSNLVVSFNSPKVEFDLNSAKLKPQFRFILDDFFPRYIKVLTMPEFKDDIVEIRIEGHTNSLSNYDEFKAYMDNMNLSQIRTRSTLRYCLSRMNDKEKYLWTRKLLTANGLSFSKPILKADGTEDYEASKRVEFRIRTNAEKKIEDIMKENNF